MSSVERGHRNVSILSMARIAGALGIPLTDLLRPRRAAGLAHPVWSADAATASDVALLADAADTDLYVDGRPAEASPARSWEPRYLSLG